jgi:hypothetical protein
MPVLIGVGVAILIGGALNWSGIVSMSGMEDESEPIRELAGVIVTTAGMLMLTAAGALWWEKK